jgi:hypothetical protein
MTVGDRIKGAGINSNIRTAQFFAHYCALSDRD